MKNSVPLTTKASSFPTMQDFIRLQYQESYNGELLVGGQTGVWGFPHVGPWGGAPDGVVVSRPPTQEKKDQKMEMSLL